MTNSAEPKNLRFRLPDDLKQAWLEMCERKKIGQQDAIRALVEFVIVQDDAAQSMLLGQTEAADDLIDVVLRRIKERRRLKGAVIGRVRGT